MARLRWIGPKSLKQITDLLASLVANHEALIRELAEKTGQDPDQVWAQAQIPRIELTCPV